MSFTYRTTNTPQQPFPTPWELNSKEEDSPYWLDGAMDGVTKAQWEALEQYFPLATEYAKRIVNLNYTEFDNDGLWVPNSPIRYILQVALCYWAGEQYEYPDGRGLYYIDDDMPGELPRSELIACGSKYWPEDLKERQVNASNEINLQPTYGWTIKVS